MTKVVAVGPFVIRGHRLAVRKAKVQPYKSLQRSRAAPPLPA